MNIVTKSLPSQSSLEALILSIVGEFTLRESVICLKRVWPNGQNSDPCYEVSAESHDPYLYPKDKLGLAIERYYYLSDLDFRCSGIYKQVNHKPYWVDLYKDID